ncbi:hypothetical protein GCM10029964_071920 [Kibdelosporangium lantanae]
MDRRTLAVPLGAAFLGGIPVNGLPVVLLLRFVTSLTATQAALLLGLYTAGNALGLVVQGRLMARHGHAVVLVVAAVVHAVALVAVARGVYVLVVVAGLAFPELNTSLRALVRTRSAVSASAALFEVASVTGPVVGGWLGDPGAVLTGSAVWMVGVTGVYVLSIRSLPRTVTSGPSAGTPRLVVLYSVPAVCFSVLAVTAGLVAASAREPVVVGLLRAILSVGALLGALWVVRRRVGMSWPCVVLVVVSVVAAVSGDFVVLVGCLFFAGTALTPITVLATLLVRRENPVATLALMQGVAVFAGGVATAGAGWLFDLGGASAAFVAAAGIAALGLLVSLWPLAPDHQPTEGCRGKARPTVGLWTTDHREWNVGGQVLRELVVEFTVDNTVVRLAAPGRPSVYQRDSLWSPIADNDLFTRNPYVHATFLLCPRGCPGTTRPVAIDQATGCLNEVATLIGWPREIVPGATVQDVINQRSNDYRLIDEARLLARAPESGVSVVIPARDSQDTIDEVLTAIIDAAGTYPWECVVVDDASDIPLRVENPDPRITVVRSDTQLFCGGARNLGLQHVRHDTVLFCDSDTLLPSNFFAAHLPLHHVAPNLITVSMRDTDDDRVHTTFTPDWLGLTRVDEPVTVRTLAETDNWRDFGFGTRLGPIGIQYVVWGHNICVSTEMARAVGFPPDYVGWGLEDNAFAAQCLARGASSARSWSPPSTTYRTHPAPAATPSRNVS